MTTLVPVILAGGEGKRLWPLSSENKPKQFLKLAEDGKSLLQATVERALMASIAENIITVANIDHQNLIKSEYQNIHPSLLKNTLWEPEPKNTAAAITLAAIYAIKNYNDPVLWVMPADHIIEKPEILVSLMDKAINQVKNDKMVTFGIKPSRADSNYGYIIPDNQNLLEDRLSFPVDKFVEKPQKDKLNWVLSQPIYLWNSGMFVFSAMSILQELKSKQPQMFELVKAAYSLGDSAGSGFTAEGSSYSNINSLSIDKIVMEHCKKLVVYPVKIGWSDVGSWFSLWELSQMRADGDSLEKFLDTLKEAA